MRLALTSIPDPDDAARPDAAGAAPDADAPRDERDAGDQGAPGVGESVGGVRAAFMRLIDAHVTLLRAELGIAGREFGIIVALAVVAVALAVLVGILLYVGTFLFLGQWLFGSMGWGIIHGTLLTGAIIGAIAIDLAGGSVRAYALGALVGLVVTIIIAAMLLSNVGNETAEWVARLAQENSTTESLPFGQEWLATLAGLAIGALAGLIAASVVVWRVGRTEVPAVPLLMIGILAGGLVGAIYASTRYDAVDGVLGLSIMLGLLTWLVAGVALAARAGFDTQARYANLVPRESIAAFEQTRDFLLEQWRKQKGRMMGR